MRVLHLCSYYFNSNMYTNLFNELEKINVVNDVIIPIRKDQKESKKYHNSIYLNCFSKIDRLFFYLKENKILKFVLKELKNQKYDYVHAHSLFTNGWIAMKLKEKYEYNYVVAIRNTDINMFFKYFFWLRKMGIRILKNSEKIIFISDAAKNETFKKYIPKNLEKELLKKSQVVPNGIDKFWLNNLYLNRENNKIKNLLFIGTLDENKNILYLINECIKLYKNGYKFNLIIAGKGKYQKNVEEYQEKYPFINYAGYITDKEKLKKLYRKADYFVLPSKYETFGLVYAEALSQGCKIVYTEGQGFDGWFEEKDIGYKTSIKNLYEILQKALDDKMTIKKDIILQIKEKFDWGIVAFTYKKIYERKK